MLVGVPKEIKDHEYRVALTPAVVSELAMRGHQVLVETKAGEGSGFPDDQYIRAGARIAPTAASVYETASLIVKIKEPLEAEYGLLQEEQVLFTYLHLAANPSLLDLLLGKRITAIAYETVEGKEGLPLLIPMSEIAGRMSVLVGAQYMQKSYGGRGMLVTSVAGIPKSRVVILGGGIVGTNAAKVALGLGAEVLILDISLARLRQLDDIFNRQVQTVYANNENITSQVIRADLVIGAVLVTGDRAPCLVKREILSRMTPGTLIVDVSVDQGGCIETTRPTTHSDPVYTVDGILHYGVSNMPGAVPRTSTIALTNATFPYLLKMLDLGVKGSLQENPGFLKGLNTCRGKVTHPMVAHALGYDYTDPLGLLG
jgi:alanine dehydrogenase